MSIKKVNTLFLYWGKKGGGAKYSFEIAKELSLRDDINLHLSLSKKCELLEQFKSLNLQTLYIDTYSTIPGFLHTWLFRKKELKQKLRNYFIENQIDSVIIGMDFFWSSIICEAASSAGVTSILVVHEPEPHPNEPFFISKFKKTGLKIGITKADHIVTLTDHVKSFVLDHYGLQKEKISVIPHGIFEYYRTTTPKLLPEHSAPVKVLYFGRIEYYKGLDILLKSFSIAEKKKDQIHLEIWGSGNIDEYSELIDKIQHIRIENRWVDEEEILQVFKTCHICVLPYRQASQSGIVGIASRAGMPIVACPAGGLKEQLLNCGAYISSDFTPQSLADGILKLMNNPEYYRSLSKKSLEYADSLSWKNIAEKFTDLVKLKI